MPLPDKKPLPKYEDCEYSLFISYAHSDDTAENGWVECLNTAITKRYESINPDITRKGIHLSAENGPSNGKLGPELKERISKSFAMLLVVGNQYVASPWCQEELKYFLEAFGEDALSSRLFIVAMTKDAIDKAKKSGSNIGSLLAKGDDQVYTAMWENGTPNDPISPDLKGKIFDAKFYEKIKKVTKPLIKAIEDDFAEAIKDGSGKTDASAKSISELIGTTQIIALAPTTPELEGRAKKLEETLKEAGGKCFPIDKALFESYEVDVPSSIEPLRKALRDADVLVVPYQKVTPLFPGLKPGGHIGILKEVWRELNKTSSIVWFEPHDLPISTTTDLLPKHRDELIGLSPLCVSQEAVSSLIFGRRKSGSITVCIEKSKNNLLYRAFVSKILDLWDSIKQNNPQIPSIICRPLNLGQNQFDKDAFGYLLTFPYGRRPQNELSAIIDSIEKELDGVGGYRGTIVAVVVRHDADKPETTKQPEILWDWFNCRQMNDESPPTLDLGSITPPDSVSGEQELLCFLKFVLERYQKSEQERSHDIA